MEFIPSQNGSKLMNHLAAAGKEFYNPVIIPATPTGFNVYDMYSGRMIQNVNGHRVLNGGIFPRLNNIIGESATGKTSKAIKDVARAVDRIRNKFGSGYSEMYILDPEGHTDTARILSLSEWSPAELVNRCNFTQEDVSLAGLTNLILNIYEVKKSYKKDFLLPSGLVDINGREVLFLAPTFIIVDSVARVNPNGIELLERDKAGGVKEIETLGSNMEAAQDAKAWTMFVRKIKPYLDEGNICLTLINHKIDDMIIDRYTKRERYLPFLNYGEKLKGGKELIYQSFHIFYITGGKPTLDANKAPVYGPEINGILVDTYFPKNKANIEGPHFPMVFDILTGYHPELSDFEYLYQSKFGLQGTSKLSFDVLPEVKFSRRELLETMNEYPAVARALAFTARYAASYAMQYYRPPPSLVDFTNIPLNQRLAILYAYTESYGKNQNYNEMIHYDQCEKIAQENRHYILTSHTQDFSNVLVNDSILHKAEQGYLINQNQGVNPYNIDEYTNGFSSFSPDAIRERDKTLGRVK
jgi:hypothetical protein